MIRAIHSLILGIALLGLAGSAFAQTPPPAPTQPSAVVSVYEGVELDNSYLKFEFMQNGMAIMHDAVSNGPVRGAYVRDGNRWTITFANCVYEGTQNGNTIAGQARLTQGGTEMWNFMVDVR